MDRETEEYDDDGLKQFPEFHFILGRCITVTGIMIHEF
jgi:hypothetical protein